MPGKQEESQKKRRKKNKEEKTLLYFLFFLGIFVDPRELREGTKTTVLFATVTRGVVEVPFFEERP